MYSNIRVRWSTMLAAVLLVGGGLAQVGNAPIVAAAAPAQQSAAQPAAAAKLPPLSYVCTMPGDEGVIEDKPGSCPICKMDLVPVRLDAKWWCPVHQALEVSDRPGKCRRDGRDLVPVTLSEFWTCSGDDTKHLEPGTCSDGKPRKIGYALRAHGDHNPRHGGQFFMASDAWHHIEGTYPEAGLVRLYFYDNFTKPLAPKDVTGTVVIRDASDKEIASAPLKPGPGPNTMEARIPAAQAKLPLRATATVKFTPAMKEQPFDFQFNEYSKDLSPGAARGPSATPPPVARAARPGSAVTVVRWVVGALFPTLQASGDQPGSVQPGSVQPGSVQPGSASPGSGSQAPAQPPDLLAGEIAPMPPALAAVLDEESLPKTVPGLVAELKRRSGEVDTLVREGSLSEVWLPAMGTKTVALVLESHADSLPPEKRAIVTSAVKRVVTTAWLIDGYGDLGNRGKIVEVYDQLAKAVSDLEGAYADVH